MRTNQMFRGCMAGAIALFGWAGSARAEPPASTTYMAISTPVIACDTKDQMMQVVQSIKEGKLRDKLSELSRVKGAGNEPVCMYSSLAPVVFGQSEHIGRIEDQDRTIDVWVSNVGNRSMGFYILWGEQVQEARA